MKNLHLLIRIAFYVLSFNFVIIIILYFILSIRSTYIVWHCAVYPEKHKGVKHVTISVNLYISPWKWNLFMWILPVITVYIISAVSVIWFLEWLPSLCLGYFAEDLREKLILIAIWINGMVVKDTNLETVGSHARSHFKSSDGTRKLIHPLYN